MKSICKSTLMLMGIATVWLLAPDSSQAQRRGPGGGRDGGREGGRDGRRGPGAGRGDMRAPGSVAKRRLGALWNGVWRLEGSGVPLSKAQAKRVVAIVRPWTNKPGLNETQAQSLVSSLNALLTSPQRKVVGDLNDGGPPGRDGGPPGRDGGPPGRDGGPRGDGPRPGRGGPPPRWDGDGPPPRRDGDGPPPGGPRPGPDSAQGKAMRSLMEKVNPFYSPTGYPEFKDLPERMRHNIVRRYQEARATLVMLSRKAT